MYRRLGFVDKMKSIKKWNPLILYAVYPDFEGRDGMGNTQELLIVNLLL